MEQQWNIDGRNFPPTSISLTFSHAQAHPPYQLAYICPVCGTVWARRYIVPQTKWLAISRACGKCPGELFIRPGSILQSWDREFFLSLPKEVLAHELVPLDLAFV